VDEDLEGGTVKLSDKAAAALEMSDTKTMSFVMTPELKKRYSEIAGNLVDWLRANTESPVEAYMVMQFTIQAFEEGGGIRGSVIVENGDAQH
jgi:hypothetical protein